MDVITKIKGALADEHVIGIDPPMRPELPNVWRRRINPFGGRSISDRALTAEQNLRSGMQRLVGLAHSPGTVEGLEISVDPASIGAAPGQAFIQLAPGMGITRVGEDVSVGSRRRLRLADLPVILRADQADRLEGEGAPEVEPAEDAAEDQPEGAARRLRPARVRRFGQTLGTITENAESAALPHVAILVAQPVTATILAGPQDDCPPDPRDDAYADLQRIDGCRIALYLWPTDVTAIDGGIDYALPPAGEAFRNRLAYRIFDNEKLFVPGDLHPWEEWGVPLGIAAFDSEWRLSFVDRFAVVRIGGKAAPRSPIVPLSGEPRLWQARIDQFVSHLTDLPALDGDTLRAAFERVPPVGILPPDMFDPTLRRQSFFPENFKVSAVAIPRSNLPLAIRETAAMASFNRGIPDRVELLVPVPDNVYDPGLLDIALEDPRFASAIEDFRSDRTNWLVRREGVRRRYDRLMESVSGQVTGWPAADLSTEENCPEPRTQVPVEITRTRRFDEQSGARTHAMIGAHATLPVAKSDTLWLWLRIRSSARLTGLSLRVGSGTSAEGDMTFAGGVYWGAPEAMPIAAEAVGLEARRAGDLPEAGIWHRLEVPASAIWTAAGESLDRFLVNAVEFTQRGGEVEWGSFGKIDAAGLTYAYIGDDAPAGAVLTVSGQAEPGWPWLDVEGRDGTDIPDFGTVRSDGVRRVSPIDGFRAEWPQPFLAQDMARIDESGLDTFLANVEARLKATNDVIDLGFVRARADIYRVRQIMLGADAASRLVTSPSLADLATRDEGARATSKGIGEFLVEAAKRQGNATIFSPGGAGQPPPPPPPPPAPGGISGPFAVAVQPSMMMLNIAAATPTPAATPLRTTLLASRRGSLAAEHFAVGERIGGAGTTVGTPVPPPPAAAPAMTAAAATPMFILPATIAATAMQTATFQPAISLNVARLGLEATRFKTRDIQLQLPVAGLVERTVSVAERLTPPPAVQALNYALATKAALIGTLSGLMSADMSRPNGISIDDILVPGFKHKSKREDEAGFIPNLAQLLLDRAKPDNAREYVDADQVPAGDKHESDYFTAAVQSIDNSIAIMRLVEGRVALFEQLARSITDLRDTILRLADEASAYFRSVDVEVEEARHDLLVAERLRAEERARADATNSRRAAILANHVEAIAWRRIREDDHLRATPVLEIASGLAEDPVVACRRVHDDVADEIEDYVELLRDAPVRWFPRLAAAVDQIQRLDSARAAIEAMRFRAMLPLRAPPPPPPSPPRLLRGVHQALRVQRRFVEERRSLVTQLNLTLLPTLSLAQTHVQIRQMATIGDLLDGRHRQPALTRMASEEIEGIGQMAGCLHESFGEVAPVIRLGWAEELSEFDRPAPLHSLAGLPNWGEVPLELRRTLQSFVDWLFSRIDRTQEEATDALNELVRICLLMAAHAPVDRIIPARLVAPAPARVGGRIELALDVSRIRKGMTALVRDREERVVSRAVIEDVLDNHASAVIVQNLLPVTTITADMRFHLVSGKG